MAYADAKAAALHALAMDDACADAQVALGTVLFLSEWDWMGAERSLRRALQISPNHTEAWLYYGSLMEALGKLEEGLQLQQQALERDPFSALVRVQIATAYWHQRRYDEAIRWAKKALDLDRKHLLAREFLAGAYLMTGDFDAFLRENVTQAESFGCPPAAIEQIRASCGRLKAAYARGGNAAVARCVLDDAGARFQDAGGSACVRFAGATCRGGRSRRRIPPPRWRARQQRPVARAPRRGAAMGRSARRSALSAAACADATSL